MIFLENTYFIDNLLNFIENLEDNSKMSNFAPSKVIKQTNK